MAQGGSNSGHLKAGLRQIVPTVVKKAEWPVVPDIRRRRPCRCIRRLQRSGARPCNGAPGSPADAATDGDPSAHPDAIRYAVHTHGGCHPGDANAHNNPSHSDADLVPADADAVPDYAVPAEYG